MSHSYIDMMAALASRSSKGTVQDRMAVHQSLAGQTPSYVASDS